MGKNFTSEKEELEFLRAKYADYSQLQEDLSKCGDVLSLYIHDLKAPMANIEMLMWSLKESLSKDSLADENVRQILTLVEESIDKHKRIIDRIRSLP